MRPELEKTFQFKDIETEIYLMWETSGAFACDPQSQKPPYTIMMPPPNVTGTLHLGHALTYTLQDVLVRFKRMQGFDTLWQPGTDHAGIATQMVVERQLAEEGLTRQDLGRQAFLDRAWEWKAQSGNTIVRQQRRLGISPDWSRQRFTLDEGLCQAVRAVFVNLYRQGLIYRDKRLVNWDTKFQSAISDLEVVSRDVKGHLWYIAYHLVNGKGAIVVATTRPETLFGDVALAVHPEDERYQQLIGQRVHLPLTDRVIPIIADTYCDPTKGTGVVKITPAHDFNDFEVGRRHGLPQLNILDSRGHLTSAVPDEFQGLSCEAARLLVIEKLEADELLMGVEPHIHTVPFGDRSGVVIQPWLTDQWFVDAHTLAQPAIKAVEEGSIRFVPERWATTYFDWLNNIQPWCISRQLWWGHQIPAWYGVDGHIFVAETEEEALRLAELHYNQPTVLTRDGDVLDTWFSAALWPFSTLGWPAQTPELTRYYPTDALLTGFDIIFFWVARMIMMGLHFTQSVPFKTVYIHALVRDEGGQKMSKSKGNSIDPLDILDKFGCDAVRLTLTALSVPGRDIKLGESRIEGYRNFITKLWNACRFLQMNGCHISSSFQPSEVQQSLNQWILTETQAFISNFSTALDTYRFDEAAQHLYHFVWGIYCDYYLEFLKPYLEEDFETNQESRATAAWVMAQILKTAHPIIPFVTEHLWQAFHDSTGPLIQQSWPHIEIPPSFYEAAEEMQWVMDVIDQVRSLRAEFRVPSNAPFTLTTSDEEAFQTLESHQAVIHRLARLMSFTLDGTHSENILTFVSHECIFALDLGESIDIAAEVDRLRREVSDHEREIAQCLQRLNNQDFLLRAKPEVVEEMGERLATATQAKAHKEHRLAQLMQGV